MQLICSKIDLPYFFELIKTKSMNLWIFISKKIHEILAALLYKPLTILAAVENGVKKIQATAYNGMCTVDINCET